MFPQSLSQDALDQLFSEARTHNAWQTQAVSDEQIQAIYDVLKMAPTSANCSPARFLFIKTAESKALLKPALSSGNVDKTMTAPVTVVVAYDAEFYERLPELFPHGDARSWFTSSAALATETAFRNSSLQAAYLILACRSLGLDTGAMSGFNLELLDQTFFEGTTWKSNLLINIGYGDQDKLYGRLPRLDFADACKIV